MTTPGTGHIEYALNAPARLPLAMTTERRRSGETAILSPDDILDLAEERRRVFADRDNLYETYQRYYRGKQQNTGPSVLAANSQGRPLLRVVGESSTRERTYTSQRLAPIIDDSQAYRVQDLYRYRTRGRDDQGFIHGEMIPTTPIGL